MTGSYAAGQPICAHGALRTSHLNATVRGAGHHTYGLTRRLKAFGAISLLRALMNGEFSVHEELVTEEALAIAGGKPVRTEAFAPGVS